MGRHEGLGPGYAPVLADGFLVHVVRHDDCFHVVVAGELDHSTSGALERQIETFVDPSSTVVLSLRDVASIDAAGVRALRTISERVRTAGGRLILKAPTPAVRTQIEATGPTTVFDFADQAKTPARTSVPAAGSGRTRSLRRA
jgi:anti-anti-sigma factor